MTPRIHPTSHRDGAPRRLLLARVLSHLFRYQRSGFRGQKPDDLIAEAAILGVDISALRGWHLSWADARVLESLQSRLAILADPSVPHQRNAVCRALHQDLASLEDIVRGTTLQALVVWQNALLERYPLTGRRRDRPVTPRTPVATRPTDPVPHAADEQLPAPSLELPETSARLAHKRLLSRRLSHACARQSGRIPEGAEPSFGARDDTLTLYLDEVWPSTPGDDHTRMQVAGLVWRGALPDPQRLIRSTAAHLRGLSLASALDRVARCHDARAVLVDIQTTGLAVSSVDYLEYMQLAVAAIVGWALPGSGWISRLRLVFEAARFAGHDAGSHSTERFAGLFDALALACPERFARWRVSEAVWLPCGAEYLGYADAIGYLCRERPGHDWLRHELETPTWLTRLDLPIERFPDWLAGRDGPATLPP